MTTSDRQQLTIVHATDLHFGDNHTFNPPDGGAEASRPKLAASILADLKQGQFAVPSEFRRSASSRSGDGKSPEPPRVVLAVTGDFNEKCLEPEFKQARAFLDGFEHATIFDREITPDDIFLVPGNHDLKYGEEAAEDRWSKYCLFYQDYNSKRTRPAKIPPESFDPRKPENLSRVIDQSKRGLIVFEINSSAYVKKDTVDERRGQIDDVAIDRMESELKRIPLNRRHAAIKVALVHHHPVVLPSLAEPDRGLRCHSGLAALVGPVKAVRFSCITSWTQALSPHL